MNLTWIEIVNNVFKAHREGDLVAKQYWMDELDEVEVDFADTLDAMAY
jgi:hypothetical protein